MDRQEEKKIQDIQLILKDLLKVIKVVTLYPENNPLPTNLRRSFAEKLENLVEDYGELHFSIDQDKISFEREVAYENKSEEDNLATIFFEAGITQFSFLPGLEVDEIYKLLDAFKTYLNSPDKTQDLISLFWENGITRVGFRSLEDIAFNDYDDNFDIHQYLDAKDDDNAVYVSNLDNGEQYQAIFADSKEIPDEQIQEALNNPPTTNLTSGVAGSQTGASIFYASVPGQQTTHEMDNDEIDEIALHTAEAASAMGLDSAATSGPGTPDTAIILNDSFKLSEEEELVIRKMCEEDAQFEPYESTVGLLKELLHQESEMTGFFETVTICEKIIKEFLLQGKLAEAAQILGYLKQLGRRLKKKKPLWSERIRDALVTCGSRDRLKALSHGLNTDGSINPIEIEMYLKNFSWESYGNITDAIGDIDNKSYRESIIAFLSEHGKEHVDFISKGIFDKRPDVVVNAVMLLAQIGTPKALSYLSKVNDHQEDSVRLMMARSLSSADHTDALKLLQPLVTDRVEEIRRAAVGSLLKRRGPEAFDCIAEVIDDDNFAVVGETDQRELLKAYAILGGEHAVHFLVKIIKTRRLFPDRHITQLRQAAFEALIFNESEKCSNALVQLSKSWWPSIKEMAQDIIRRRREHIFGGDQ